MTWLWACDRCREPFHLFAVVKGKYLCSQCWKRAGRPYPNRDVVKK